MLTNRQAIDQLRDFLRERSADSTYSNQFLYRVLEKHAKWLIRREASSNRIFKSQSLFQTLRCFDIMETSPIDESCDIQVGCTIYRTTEKLPEIWESPGGPMIKEVKSIDGSYVFTPASASAWVNIDNSPYNKFNKSNYYFYSSGYLYFPRKAPKQINVVAYFKDDISLYGSCSSKKESCSPFLDRPFRVPDWIEGEMFAKAIEELAGVPKRIPEDEQIDANTNRKS